MRETKVRKEVKIHFEPDNVDIVVAKGTNLLKAAIDAGVHISASCGGEGFCGTCKVFVERGEVQGGGDGLSPEEWEKGVRKACQSTILADLEVSIPVESRLETAVVGREAHLAATGAGSPEATATGWRFKPPLSKCYLELPPPTLGDNTSDLSRLLRGLRKHCKLGHIRVAPDVLQKLPRVMHRKNYKVTATMLVKAISKSKPSKRMPKLINVEPGNTINKHYALAFDIGTTTVCGQLLDLNRGEVVAEAVTVNRQIVYGEDVITRIARSQRPGGLKELQRAVVNTINEIIIELRAKGNVSLRDIGHMTVAGNTTMTHILLGIDPKYIRLAPYTPVASFFPPVRARSLGVRTARHVHLFSFPSVASYVGGDIISGVVASGMHQSKKLTFYIDIGTNGEIVIGNSEWMITTACSAGPAFEGGGIRHGMIAANGAIEDFSIDSQLEPEVHTVGGEKPKGICGSGLLNIIAKLLEAGLISPKGKFNVDADSARIRIGSDGYEYVIVAADDTQIGRDIVITEVDIDNLMRAKAAMYAGCRTLSGSVGIPCSELEQVIIAGAFGSHLDIENCITIGLLPDIPRDRFIFAGNESLAGSRLVSFSTDLLDDAREVATMMTNFELSENHEFMHHYVAGLFLPNTHAEEFPRVSKRLTEIGAGRSKGG